jgi:hypothetical protein
MRILIGLILLVFLAGCIDSQVNGGGLFMKLQPDPQQIFSGGVTRINIDMENNNPREITDVVVDVFDTGRLLRLDDSTSICYDDQPIAIGDMQPNSFRSYYCTLIANKIEEPMITTEINTKISYKTDFPVVQVVGLISENEYLNRRGQLDTMPQSYSYQDANVQLAVDFSEQLPIIIRPGKDYFVYFTIRNVGNGFINKLKAGDFVIRPVRSDGPQIVDCSNSGIESSNWYLDPVGKEFPKIACRIVLPQGVAVVENYGLLVDLIYTYEVRGTTTVDIIR